MRFLDRLFRRSKPAPREATPPNALDALCASIRGGATWKRVIQPEHPTDKVGIIITLTDGSASFTTWGATTNSAVQRAGKRAAEYGWLA